MINNCYNYINIGDSCNDDDGNHSNSNNVNDEFIELWPEFGRKEREFSWLGFESQMYSLPARANSVKKHFII